MAKRKYLIDESYFESIDSEQKAYFLGFLYADGYINEKIYTVSITLQKQDFYILEKLLKPISPDKKLLYIKSQDLFRLVLCSKKIVSDLIKLGCFQAKTFTLKFPTKEQVPEYLLPHFIRGYFDGDGSLYINYKNMSCAIDMVGSTNFINSICQYLKTSIGINSEQKRANKTTSYNRVDRLRSGGRLQCIKFLDFIYDNATIFLIRKYNKYKEIKNYHKKKRKDSKKNTLLCCIENCKGKFQGLNFCSKHYANYYYHKTKNGILIDDFIRITNLKDSETIKQSQTK